MGRYTIEHTTRTAGSPAEVYRLLRDGATWPVWGPVSRFALEREGDGEREGVGAIRVLGNGPLSGRDEITGFERDRSFSYVHLGGLPVRDYAARVTITPAGAGADITWRTTFDPRFPGTGRIVHLALSRFIKVSLRGLARHAAG